MTDVRILAKAQADIERIDTWWQANRLGSPLLFRTELEEALRVLAGQPETAPTFATRRGRTVRRLILGASRAHVYYVAHDRGKGYARAEVLEWLGASSAAIAILAAAYVLFARRATPVRTTETATGRDRADPGR